MHFNQKVTHMKLNFFICISLITFSNTSFSAQIDATKAIQSFPTKPIRLIVPQAPGGSNDIMARYFGNLLSERISRQVVVDNRAGAEGMIATELVAKSAPDGYTLLMTSTAFAMNPAVVNKLPYDPMKDFDFIALLGRGPLLVAVGPNVPVLNMKELIALGKSKPNYLTIASAGGLMHFASAMFRSHAGFDAVIALYKGGGPAMIDVIAGNAQVAVPTYIAAAPFIKSGRIKVLATSTANRLPTLPDLPTAVEAGIPGFEATVWWAWSTAAKTPIQIVNKLNAIVTEIQKLPETTKRLAMEGGETEIKSPNQLREMMKTEIIKWDKVARDAKMPMLY